jgi:hypothetical protein
METVPLTVLVRVSARMCSKWPKTGASATGKLVEHWLNHKAHARLTPSFAGGTGMTPHTCSNGRSAG